MLKTCSKCKNTIDAMTGFHKDANRKDGLAAWCKPCAIASAKRYYAAGPIDSNVSRRKRSHISSQERAARNRVVTARGMMLKKYGITYEQYEEMYSRQGGNCLICCRHHARLCVDHCHSSGVVRGLLCKKCNSAIGLLNDDPALLKVALSYLLNYGGWKQPKTPAGAAIVTWQ